MYRKIARSILFILLLIIPSMTYAQNNTLWFLVTESSCFKSGQTRDMKCHFKLKIEIKRTPLYNGIVTGYTQNGGFMLTLFERIEKVENKQGIIFKWKCVDHYAKKGTCSLYVNRNGTFQFLIEFENDQNETYFYNMHSLD